MARNQATQPAVIEPEVEVDEVDATNTETPQVEVEVEGGEKQPEPAAAVKIEDVDLSGHESKSAKMRLLASKGFKTAEIAKHLSTVYGSEVKYQFVRNVLMSPAPKAS